MNCGVNVMNVTIISLAVNVKTSYDIIDLDHLIQLLQSHLTSPTPPLELLNHPGFTYRI